MKSIRVYARTILANLFYSIKPPRMDAAALCSVSQQPKLQVYKFKLFNVLEVIVERA